MKMYYFTRKEIAEELRIDPKTLRRRLREEGIVLEKGLIPVEKVKAIKVRLSVEPPMLDNNRIQQLVDEKFNKFDRSILNGQ